MYVLFVWHNSAGPTSTEKHWGRPWLWVSIQIGTCSFKKGRRVIPLSPLLPLLKSLPRLLERGQHEEEWWLSPFCHIMCISQYYLVRQYARNWSKILWRGQRESSVTRRQSLRISPIFLSRGLRKCATEWCFDPRTMWAAVRVLIIKSKGRKNGARKHYLVPQRDRHEAPDSWLRMPQASASDDVSLLVLAGASRSKRPLDCKNDTYSFSHM